MKHIRSIAMAGLVYSLVAGALSLYNSHRWAADALAQSTTPGNSLNTSDSRELENRAAITLERSLSAQDKGLSQLSFSVFFIVLLIRSHRSMTTTAPARDASQETPPK